jgi:Ribulose-5-phosphate 4-epimerase and related epimerases and aldolases
MKQIMSNAPLMKEISRIQEVAGYLWEKGWAERNGGNISVNVSEFITDEIKALPALSGTIPFNKAYANLGGHYFYITGTGKRMRYVAQDAFENGSIIRLTPDGSGYEIVATKPIAPTSELPSHIAMHSYMRSTRNPNNKVVLHTHPTEIIGMSHHKKFLKPNVMAKTLWAMIPESRIIVPRGIGIVGYEIPGTMELAKATIKQLEKHDMVVWEKHGILCVGDDIIEAF